MKAEIGFVLCLLAMLPFMPIQCRALPNPGPHPRLLVTRDGLPDFRDRLKQEPLASVARQLKEKADSLLEKTEQEPQSAAAAGDLATVRRFQGRIWLLASAYLMTGDERYARRACREMLALGNLPAWMDPRHVSQAKGADLATGEACAAMGIGYDWVYPALKDSERETLRSMLLSKGLRPYVAAVEAGAWWAKVYHNWNPVVNGGCGVGALAILGEDETADQALSSARANIRHSWEALPPDGGWNEGVAYWHYAMRYGLLFAAALQSAVGTDDGPFTRPGARQTGYFGLLFTAPDGRSAMFCDDGGGAPGGSILYLLARCYNDPAFYWQRRTYGKGAEPLDPIWMPLGLPAFYPSALPRSKLFPDIEWAMLRSDPGQPQEDIYLAFKSGDLAANHSHLDLNSFILVAYGERLAIDPGAGAYVEGYFGPNRWQFYHPSTKAHNTILVNGAGQQPKSRGEITVFEGGEGYDYLVGRAGEAYGGALQRFDRHVVFVDKRYFVIFDELEAAEPSQFDWLLHTTASVNASGRRITIEGAKAALDVEVISPARFSFSAEEGPDTIIHISPAQQAAGQEFLIVLYPRRADEKSASVSALDGAEGVKVTLPSGRTDTISFERRAGEWHPRVRIGERESRPAAGDGGRQ